MGVTVTVVLTQRGKTRISKIKNPENKTLPRQRENRVVRKLGFFTTIRLVRTYKPYIYR